MNHPKLLATLLVAGISSYGAVLDFRQAAIVIGTNPSPRIRKAAQMISEEVEKRTQLRLKTAAEAKSGSPAIIIAKPAGGAAEGFTFTTGGEGTADDIQLPTFGFERRRVQRRPGSLLYPQDGNAKATI